MQLVLFVKSMGSILCLVVLKWSSLFDDVCHTMKHNIGKNKIKEYIHTYYHITMDARHQIHGHMQGIWFEV